MNLTNPIWSALLGGLFTWSMTALGASVVFFLKNINIRISNFMLGFSAGIMIAASFWSLLLPAAELCGNEMELILNVIGGFGLGGVFVFGADKMTDKTIHMTTTPQLRRSFLLILAITIHNIPEGLSFGVAYGNAAADATALALGIGLQNFPEGAAVALPLRKEGYSRKACFFYGQASAFVEPAAAVFGAWLASSIDFILPFALSFAAGAMIYVVVEELIPNSQSTSHLYGHCATWGAMLGFMVMTLMDIVIG